MTKTKRIIKWSLIVAAGLLLMTVLLLLYVVHGEYGFAREVSDEEAALRLQIVETAEEYLGCQESDGTHQPIIDLYNSHEPLAQGYTVQYEDDWCAAFGSAMAISCNLTDIIPTECGCQRQIGLFQELNRWEEDDGYTPLPGDYIYYAWGESPFGDCTGWADHVGIVVGTLGPFIKVIEGNKDDAVAYRYILVGDPQIRGYGLPNYSELRK